MPTTEERRKAYLCVAYLAGCAVNGAVPAKEELGSIKIKEQLESGILYKAADRHMMTSLTAFALESAGIFDPAFEEAKARAIRKNVLLDHERGLVTAELEAAGIAYMPLKGALLQKDYPAYGMRQMADNDILIDASRAADVKGIMESLGFETDFFDISAHDTYKKPPVYYFEMHRALFADPAFPEDTPFIRDLWSRLVKDPDSSFGYSFTDEDFYVYLTAHAYKHLNISGTGLRSLLDIYVWQKKHGASADRDKICEGLEELGLSDFEKKARRLAELLFGYADGSKKRLPDGIGTDPEEEEMLYYIMDSGTYGTVIHGVENAVQKEGRLKYFFGRIFLPYRAMCGLYPVLKKIPVLLPFCWVARWIKAIVRKPRLIATQTKTAFRTKKKK